MQYEPSLAFKIIYLVLHYFMYRQCKSSHDINIYSLNPARTILQSEPHRFTILHMNEERIFLSTSFQIWSYKYSHCAMKNFQKQQFILTYAIKQNIF